MVCVGTESLSGADVEGGAQRPKGRWLLGKTVACFPRILKILATCGSSENWKQEPRGAKRVCERERLSVHFKSYGFVSKCDSKICPP